jgi:hypothetical protein
MKSFHVSLSLQSSIVKYPLSLSLSLSISLSLSLYYVYAFSWHVQNSNLSIFFGSKKCDNLLNMASSS